jgi:hypothetical protein
MSRLLAGLLGLGMLVTATQLSAQQPNRYEPRQQQMSAPTSYAVPWERVPGPWLLKPQAVSCPTPEALFEQEAILRRSDIKEWRFWLDSLGCVQAWGDEVVWAYGTEWMMSDHGSVVCLSAELWDGCRYATEDALWDGAGK